jgi:VCBS repeat-containing protein
VIDSHGAASTATVALTVSGSAVPEPALLQGVQVEEDASSMNLYQDILDGAATVLGEEVSFVSVDTVGTLGTVSLGADSLVYTADDPILDGLWGDDHLNTQFLYTVRTADGELHTGAVDVRVTGLGDVPEASPDSFAVGEGGSTGNLWNTLLANDFDADEGQEVDIATVSTVGTVGRVSLDTAGNSLVYHADTAAIMALNPGETLTDHFTYTLKGAYGAPESTTTVTVTVTGEGMTMMAMDQSDTEPAHSADAFSAPLSWGGSSGAEAGWALL